MAGAPFDRERAARIVSEADHATDKAVAKKHRISARTIRGWRKRAATDPLLAAAIRGKKERLDKAWEASAILDWAAKLPEAIGGAIDYLARAAKEASATDPDAIHSVAGALKILTDVATVRRVVDARLSKQEAAREPDAGSPRQAGPSGAPDRPGVPPGARPAPH